MDKKRPMYNVDRDEQERLSRRKDFIDTWTIAALAIIVVIIVGAAYL